MSTGRTVICREKISRFFWMFDLPEFIIKHSDVYGRIPAMKILRRLSKYAITKNDPELNAIMLMLHLYELGESKGAEKGTDAYEKAMKSAIEYSLKLAEEKRKQEEKNEGREQ